MSRIVVTAVSLVDAGGSSSRRQLCQDTHPRHTRQSLPAKSEDPVIHSGVLTIPPLLKEAVNIIDASSAYFLVREVDRHLHGR